MINQSPPRPTDAELEILNVLYSRGPSTVREVHEELNKTRPLVYTTVLKMMQIMADKGLLRRDETARAHLYEASLTQDQTQRSLVADLMQRAFEGSASKLVMQALSGKKTSAKELTEIKQLLKDLEGGKK
jgi:BlaI family transcriptional regulator, penicillinase repressor